MKTNKLKEIKKKETRNICDEECYNLSESVELIEGGAIIKSKSLWKIITNKIINLTDKNIN
jgi:hypothetical protein